MKKLHELSTVQEVDGLIDEICRNMPLGYQAEVERGKRCTEGRATDMKLDALCAALERRAELELQS